MLVFKARRRVSPALRAENTPSEKRVIQNLVQARREVESWIDRNITSLMDAIAHRPWTTVADMLPVEPWYEFQEYLQGELLAETIDAGFRATDGPVGKATTPLLGYRFDATRPEASSWAARESGALVTEITAGQRTLIRDLISRGQVEGITVDQTARTIRQSVGLTTQQSGWVDNFYGRNLTDNIGAGMSLPQATARAEAATGRYHDRIHRYRAETIARTEIARAASEGRQLAWNQGIEQGFISINAQKEWIAEADACEICSPRNGTRHPVNKPWPGGEPPAHPNCRCDLLLIPVPVEKPLLDVAALADSLSRSALEALIFAPVDLAQDFALRRVITSMNGDANDRARRLAERRDQLAREGRPERRAIYEARNYQERTGLQSYTRTKRDSFTIRLDDKDVQVRSKYRFSPTDEIREIFESGGISTPDMYELAPSEAKLFHRLILDAKNSNKYGASVQDYDVSEYAKMRLFITDNGGAGFALKDGDELVSVFRGDTSLKGVADHMVHLSIQQGARRADAFDTVLPHIYGDHGFVVVARTPWNDEFSPPGWNKKTFSAFNSGEPDVVFMAHIPTDYYGYFPGMGMTFGKNQYDDAYEYTKRVLGWFSTRTTPRDKPDAPDVKDDIIDTSYRAQHQAPGPDYGASMDDVRGMYPDDFYDGNALRYYGTGDDVADRQSLQAIMTARDDPNAMITVYRAVPRNVDSINDGDWVTPSLSYARTHGDNALGGDYVILDITVPARHLWTNADSLNEWGLYRGVLPDAPTPPVASVPTQVKTWDDPNLDADELADLIEQDFRGAFRDAVMDVWPDITDLMGWEFDDDFEVDVSETSVRGIFKIVVTAFDGTEILTAKRAVGGDTVDHELFEVAKEFQGIGIGTRVYDAAIDLYRNRGIKFIELTAGLDVGGYAWAKRGFDWRSRSVGRDGGPREPLASSIGRLLDRILREAKYDKYGVDDHASYVEEVTAEVRAIESMLDDPTVSVLDWPTPADLARIGWRRGMYEWPGKDGMLGSTWDGRLTL